MSLKWCRFFFSFLSRFSSERAAKTRRFAAKQSKETNKSCDEVIIWKSVRTKRSDLLQKLNYAMKAQTSSKVMSPLSGRIWISFPKVNRSRVNFGTSPFYGKYSPF